jgi:flagellar motility protein MotE (MotC chaperone)
VPGGNCESRPNRLYRSSVSLFALQSASEARDMARRASEKRPVPRRSSSPRGVKSEAAADGGDEARSREARTRALEADLAAARERIRELEARQGEIADRIAWALDSLHDFVGDER